MSCLSNGKYQNWTAQFRVHGVNTGADLFFMVSARDRSAISH